MRVAEDLVAATSFLTRVPTRPFERAAITRAAPLFPLVGAAVGALAGGAVELARGPLPAFAAAALGLAVAALLTGAMHLDALADTADALGGMTRERRLEIMRDHAIGSFGAVALVVVLLFEVSVLAAVESPWSVFAVAAACGRWAALPLSAFLPYARPGDPVLAASWRGAAAGLVVAGGLALALRGVSGLAAIGAAAAVALLLGVFFRRWLGGVTGDTLGATTELAQAAALAALLVYG